MADIFSNPSGRPIMTTLAIGPDYVKALQPCLDSKEAYAKKHGYTYIQGGEQFWDRYRPIAWSKIGFLLNVLDNVPEGSLIWQSDADVLITNADLTIEQQLVSLLPPEKDLLMSLDACGHINSGNILIRNTKWSRSFWKRVGELKQFTYHPWWENAAMCCLWENNKEDFAKIEITRKHKMMNAYLRAIPGEGMWEPGDFLVHFAGVYDIKKMADFAAACQAGETPRIPMDGTEIQACMTSRDGYLRLMQGGGPK